MENIRQRIDKLRREMQLNNMDAFLVTSSENIRYLSGFTGGSDAKLMVSHAEKYIITDSRYFEQTAIECPDWELVKASAAGTEGLVSLTEGLSNLGFESNNISYDGYLQLKDKLQPDLLPARNLVEKLRIIKDEDELDKLRMAARIGDQVFTSICQVIKSGMSEKEVANLIVALLKDGGCSKESFDTIAVAGKNAALPHGQPSDYRLQPGDMLTMDFGGMYQGYAGDMTRTVVISQASAQLRSYYLQLLEAQELGVSLVQAGMDGKELDQKVRDHLQKYQLDAYFAHGTGHGVGLEIHEAPRLSLSSNDVLEENMVVTVEPGIYIPGWGGIRIEDTVIVKKGGCEVITHSDKSLLII
ncbi:MAG TPA: Xaa-Pro peptidase family protein [Syntrophomonas sp.]|nr:Xaa-Pro peptidase family protein [Syntrophomonas sp.]